MRQSTSAIYGAGFARRLWSSWATTIQTPWRKSSKSSYQSFHWPMNFFDGQKWAIRMINIFLDLIFKPYPRVVLDYPFVKCQRNHRREWQFVKHILQTSTMVFAIRSNDCPHSFQHCYKANDKIMSEDLALLINESFMFASNKKGMMKRPTSTSTSKSYLRHDPKIVQWVTTGKIFWTGELIDPHCSEFKSRTHPHGNAKNRDAAITLSLKSRGSLAHIAYPKHDAYPKLCLLVRSFTSS